MAVEDWFYPYLKYYQKLPPSLMRFIGGVYRKIPLGLRYGNVFESYYSMIVHSQYWDTRQRREYVRRRLAETLGNAYRNSEYFKESFTAAHLNPTDFEDADVIRRIPFIDKDILRGRKQQILNRNIGRNQLLYTTTGGTSGVPVEVYLLKGVERARELAFMTRQWERVGYRFGDKLAVLRGTVVNNKAGNSWYKYEPIKNRLLLSNFDLNENTLPKYIDKIVQFGPKFIHSYPSAISVIAKYLVKQSVRIRGVAAVFCSSEQFYPGQRELIEQAFNARVYSWYGHTEAGTLAGECEYSSDYHVFFEYGLTELVDPRGEVITEPGVQGEIVTTSFEMSAFPIIRYRTGDYAEYSPNKCKCGRTYSLIRNVKGRWLQEFIIGNDDTKISLTALNMHNDVFRNILQYQFYQKDRGKVTLRVVPAQSFTNQDRRNILGTFQDKFRDKVHLAIEVVPCMPTTSVGKHKFLIQEIEE